MDLFKIIKDKYLYLVNGIKKEGNVNTLDFNSDDIITLVEDINKDTLVTINIGKGCNVNLFEVYNNVSSNYKMIINLEDDSTLFFTSLRKSLNDINVNITINFGKNAKLVSKNINLFSNQVKVKQDLNMNNELSIIEAMDVVVNNSGKMQSYDYETIHKGSLSNCLMRNYVINNNSSITHMNTNGKIEKNVKGVVLSQKTKGLLLDMNSEISANPWLAIDEYDCNASHGASIGAIDEEELFYLMSRGLTRSESERLIVNGFINPFIENIKDNDLSNYVLEEIKEVL